MTYRKFIRGSVLASVVMLAVLLPSLAHPTAPAVQEKPLFRGSEVDSATLALFQRACQNCHSENSQWPWYSRLPPASFLIAKDVNDARHHVNFSRWESYGPEEQRDLLSRIGSLVRSRQMPLPRYTWLHHEAVLTPAERQQIYNWTRAERKRLLHDIVSASSRY